ncbi:LamG-like jellyroll fold domain-containing protein [Parafrigoribacterium soli]|uniref:LamG-like jellyroll fold domain-containing protein n=1 Tax=Parafrigoribacterium soli TaxID=3144663 RepID=UPI0032ED2416
MNTVMLSRLPRFFAAALALALALAFVPSSSAFADTAPVDPTNPASPPTVSADALPTVQINGVAWSQVVVGNTVYVAGKFTTARPAGVAAGGPGTVTRNNLLAYDITTGNLITTFAPSLNAQALSITASPDGSRIYVVGDFTSIDGAGYYRAAAFSTATGQIIPSFRPILGSQGRSISVTNSTVYLGGTFRTVNGVARDYIAALSAADGSVLPWTASTNDVVDAMTLTKDGSKLVVGGRFTSLAGTNFRGLGAVDASTGAAMPWPTNNLVRNAGADASITSLYATADRVYGSGYVFGDGGNLEGIFSADPATGELQWVEDCHGDTYSVYPLGDVVYGASHSHYCGGIGGFPQTNPWTMHYALAFSKAATHTLSGDPLGYYDFRGNPAPTLLNWFPKLTPGTFTGQGQAGWSVSGNDKYVVYGGEFTNVNGTPQNGLVRFALPSIAPNKVAPIVNTELVPNIVSFKKGEVRISWEATYDYDNANLTYSLVRDGAKSTPVFETNQQSNFYTRPQMGYIDKGLTPGSTHSYRLYVTDPYGNSISRLGPTVTVASNDSGGAYSDAVEADSPASYWPLDEASGSVGYDHSGFSDLTLGSGVTLGTDGIVASQTAATFDGSSSGSAAPAAAVDGPNTFTAETWFRTTSTSGGKILGFGSSATGTSSSYDRHIYMDNSGRIWFGVYPGSVQTVNSNASFNDGQWHQVAASLGSGGMTLYIDGKIVGSRTDVTSAQAYSGYWRVGGDNIGGWPSSPTSKYFAGDIAQVAIYPSVLSRQQVVSHLVASGRTSPIPPAPSDAYGASVYNSDPLLYWRLDDAGSSAKDSGQQGNSGTYYGSVGRGEPGAIAGFADSSASFGATSAGVASDQQFTNPTTYSLETWFQTTTTSGGKLIGFGNAQSGLSSNYDRHLYMQDDGKLVFGTWTGQTNTVTSGNSYNDGQWHYAVAMQSGDGIKLYVDGALVGTNPQTAAQSYSGYWRIGGDTTWGSSSPYFNGRLDEVAVYSQALSQDTVSEHFALGTGGTPPNQNPTAAFSSSSSDLTASFDASASSDPDGTISGYAWDFGDGHTGSGSTTTHSYAAGGTFTVTLTVTDNAGASTTVSHPVTVTAPVVVQPLAQDAFARTVASGWGSADTGGAWTITGNAASLQVGGGTGQVSLQAGSTRTATLGSVSARDVDATVTLAMDSVPTGGGAYANLFARQSGTANYAADAWIRSNGTVYLVLKQGGTVLSSAQVSGLTYTAGTALKLRAQVIGSSPTTIRAKIWSAAQAEPSGWLSSVTDSTSALQGPGSLALQAYLSGSATAPIVARFDDFVVMPPQ